MKLKTRIIVGFGMSILVPLLLFSATLYGLGHTKLAQQTKDSSEVVYDISVGESTHRQTAAYGHFGRTDVVLPGEHLDKVDDLKKYLA